MKGATELFVIGSPNSNMCHIIHNRGSKMWTRRTQNEDAACKPLHSQQT